LKAYGAKLTTTMTLVGGGWWDFEFG